MRSRNKNRQDHRPALDDLVEDLINDSFATAHVPLRDFQTVFMTGECRKGVIEKRKEG